MLNAVLDKLRVAWTSLKAPRVPLRDRWPRRSGMIDGVRWRVFAAGPTARGFGDEDLEPQVADWLALPCATSFRALRATGGEAPIPTGDPAFDAQVELGWDPEVVDRLGPADRQLLLDLILDGGEVTGDEVAVPLHTPTNAAIDAVALRLLAVARRLLALPKRTRLDRLSDPSPGAALLAAERLDALTEKERRTAITQAGAALRAGVTPERALRLVTRWGRPGELDPDLIVPLLAAPDLAAAAIGALGAVGDARHIPHLVAVGPAHAPAGATIGLRADPAYEAVARIQARLGPSRAGEVSLSGDPGWSIAEPTPGGPPCVP